MTAIVSWTKPEATDNSGQNPTVTCNREPGSEFGLGGSVVTCKAVDLAGNQATCAFSVTVQLKGMAINDRLHDCDNANGI